MFTFAIFASILLTLVTISSAAPANTEFTTEDTFEQTNDDEWTNGFEPPIEFDEWSVEEQNADALNQFQCAIHIIDEAMGEQKNETWEKVKLDVKEHMDKLENCNYPECTVSTGKTIAFVIQTYIIQLSQGCREIVEGFGGQLQRCGLSAPNFIDDTPSKELIDYFVGVLECVIDVVRNVTAEYKLTTLWASHTNAFQMHLANIKRCYTTDARDDEEVVEECLGVAAYREFMDLMKEADEKTAEKMIRLYKSVCIDGASKEQSIS